MATARWVAIALADVDSPFNSLVDENCSSRTLSASEEAVLSRARVKKCVSRRRCDNRA